MKLLLSTLVVILLLATCGCGADGSQVTLKEYPHVFGEATIIITGNQTSPVEIESAEIIADNLKKETGNDVTVIDITDLLETDKTENNLILVVTPKLNNLQSELMMECGIETVTDEYPGANKGILEIAINPWNEEKVVLLVGGSDQWGLKAAVLVLEDMKTKRASLMVVYWEEYTGVEFPIDSKAEAIRYAKLDHDVRAYIDWLLEKDWGVQYHASQSPSSLEWRVGIEENSMEVDDVWMDINFLPDGTVTFKGEGSV